MLFFWEKNSPLCHQTELKLAKESWRVGSSVVNLYTLLHVLICQILYFRFPCLYLSLNLCFHLFPCKVCYFLVFMFYSKFMFSYCLYILCVWLTTTFLKLLNPFKNRWQFNTRRSEAEFYRHLSSGRQSPFSICSFLSVVISFRNIYNNSSISIVSLYNIPNNYYMYL